MICKEEITKEIEYTNKIAIEYSINKIYNYAEKYADGNLKSSMFFVEDMYVSILKKYFSELYEIYELETHPRLGWYNVVKKIEELYPDVI